jgi:hypothetical protein
LGASATFARTYQVAVGSQAAATLAPEAALSLYRDLRIGEERIADESGSDLFSTTVSQTLATAALVVGSQNLRFGLLNNALKAARAPLLLLHLMVRNATGGRAGAMVDAVLLAGGGLVVGLDVLTSQGLPGILVTAGWVAFAAGMLLILLRTRLGVWRIALPVVAVTALGVFAIWISASHGWRAFFDRQRFAAVVVLGLVAVLVYVGSLHRPKAGPTRTSLRRRHWPWTTVLGVEVDGQEWERVNSLRAAAPDAMVYQVRRGRVHFGGGTHGRKPPRHAEITVRYQ